MQSTRWYECTSELPTVPPAVRIGSFSITDLVSLEWHPAVLRFKKWRKSHVAAKTVVKKSVDNLHAYVILRHKSTSKRLLLESYHRYLPVWNIPPSETIDGILKRTFQSLFPDGSFWNVFKFRGLNDVILNFRQSKLVCAINAAVNVYSKFLKYLDR